MVFDDEGWWFARAKLRRGGAKNTAARGGQRRTLACALEAWVRHTRAGALLLPFTHRQEGQLVLGVRH